MAEGKDDDIERFRRLFAGVPDKRKEPSRLKKIMTRLRTRKSKSGTKSKKKTDDAA
jgi:hypothetical protein